VQAQALQVVWLSLMAVTQPAKCRLVVEPVLSAQLATSASVQLPSWLVATAQEFRLDPAQVQQLARLAQLRSKREHLVEAKPVLMNVLVVVPAVGTVGYCMLHLAVSCKFLQDTVNAKEVACRLLQVAAADLWCL
jgi:hypothetical protein